jgi:hypothetical protein
VTWVIDVSLGDALGARTAAFSTVPVDGDDCLLAGLLGVPFLPNFGF